MNTPLETAQKPNTFKEKENLKLDIMNIIETLYCRLYDGWECKKCKVIQGLPLKGHKKYYCMHITEGLNKLFNPISKRICQEIIIESKEFI